MSISDDEIRRIIAEEATQQGVRAQAYGPLAYLHKPSARSSVKSINKDFLSNTIKSVDSHNRREVIYLMFW